MKKEVGNLWWSLPVLLVVGVLPFITKFIVYDTGLSGYLWYPENGTAVDFYVYYKSRFFQMIALILCIVLPFHRMLFQSKKMSKYPCLLLCGYMLCIVLSTIFSKDLNLSLVGMMDHFENIFVLLGYCILFFYVYQISRKENIFYFFVKVLVVAVIIMGIIGVYQLCTGGLISSKFLQRLVMSKQDYQIYQGKLESAIQTGALSLTLDNPNYAGVYCSMILSFFSVMLLYQKNKWILSGFLISVFLLICTYSRTGILSFLVTMFILALVLYKTKSIVKKQVLTMTFILFLFFSLFFLVEYFNDFTVVKKIEKTVEKLFCRPEKNKLEKILTLSDRILILYGENEVVIKYDDDGNLIVSGQDYEGWLSVIPERLQEEQELCITIDEMKWNFKREGGEYWYFNDFGKLEKITEIAQIDLYGFESIASNRGYIWSRSLPLLWHSICFGSGPETFPIVFPQNDRVGKYHYCKNIYTMIEKPHSMYLSIGIQTGLLSLVLFGGFYIWYAVSSIRMYRSNGGKSFIYYFALSCFLLNTNYMICGFFVDSSVQTSPLFWISAALGISANDFLKVRSLNVGELK